MSVWADFYEPGNQACPASGSPRGRLFIRQCLKALLTLSPACLMLPVAWPARPFAVSRRFPVTRPVTFFVLPLAVSALCPKIFLMFTTLFPIPGFYCQWQMPSATEARHAVSAFAGT